MQRERAVDAARGNVRQAPGVLGIRGVLASVEHLVGGRSSAVYMLGFGSPIGIGRQGAKAPRSDRSDRSTRVAPILAPWRLGGGSDLERERTYVLKQALAGGVFLATSGAAQLGIQEAAIMVVFALSYRVAHLVPRALVGVPLLIATWGGPRRSLAC